MPDTIVALATPNGKSGIGVIRLSGPDALAISAKLGAADLAPRKAVLRSIIDPVSGDAIDEAVVTYFQGPNSFTGEDVVEVSCHGSPVLLRQVIDQCLSAGARPAEAGEFTLRALMNGRIDLTEAEAIRDLIDSQTSAAALQAVRQMRGAFSSELQPLKDDLLDVIVTLESALEFVEDDLPAVQIEGIERRLVEIADRTAGFAATYHAGHLIRDGLRVAIVGRPNVGKSSLFNALLGTDRAIVTDIAGTTRDHLHERLVIDNIPISLIDTAGLRETDDKVESIGVERSRSMIADADLVVLLFDASEELAPEDRSVIEETSVYERLMVLNKIDKVEAAANNDFEGENVVRISAKYGQGIDELKGALIQPFAIGEAERSGFLITDARHHDLLTRAAADIRESLTHLGDGVSEEITLIGLHNAIRYFGQITGEVTTEDMLTRIFSTFCIGK
jgi:tRNA modification GTPase